MKFLLEREEPSKSSPIVGCFALLLIIFMFGMMLALAIFGLASVLMAISFLLETISTL